MQYGTYRLLNKWCWNSWIFQFISVTQSWSNYIILCHPLLLLFWITPSIRVFSKELVFHIRWLKYWSFSFSISPSNDYSGLISFRIDWFDLLVAQGTLKSLIHHHNLKALILQCSAFVVVQFSYPYMTTVCMYICMYVWLYLVITLTGQAFDSKVQPEHTPFPIWNQSVVPCPILTAACWPAYRFLTEYLCANK